jgi:TetR/AcrR family fatty acid metabolism transcriptional regulator
MKQPVSQGNNVQEISRGRPKKQPEKGINRDAILKAAGDVFSEKGFHYTKMEDIAGRAECSTGTLYNYFHNKEELYVTVIDDNFNRLFESFNEIIDRPDEKFASKLEEVMRFAFQFADQHRSFAKLAFNQQAYMTSELLGSMVNQGMSWYKHFLDSYSRLLFQGIKEKVLRPLNPADLAHLFLGIQQEYFQEWLFSPVDYKLAEKTPLFLDLFLHGAGAPGPSGRREE